jgi:hypothetical protein
MCAMLGLLGMGLQMFGAIAGGMAQKKDAELQAEVARMNADVAEKTADTNTVLAELPGIAAKLDTQKIKDAVRISVGAQTATYSTANMDPSFGAPLLAAGISVAQGAVDIGLTAAQAALSKAARLADAASGYAGAATERFKVVAADNEADNAMMRAFLGAGTALVSGLQNLGLGGGSGMFGGSAGASAFAGSTAGASAGAPLIRPAIASPSIGYGGYIPGGYAGTRIVSSAYAPGDRDYRGQ